MIIKKTDKTMMSKENRFLVNDDAFVLFKNKGRFYISNMTYLIIKSEEINFNNEITIKRKEAK